jgi:hypothetical protein
MNQKNPQRIKSIHGMAWPHQRRMTMVSNSFRRQIKERGMMGGSAIEMRRIL